MEIILLYNPYYMNNIYRLAMYQSYHDGCEKIEGAYQTVLDGLNNLNETFDSFKNGRAPLALILFPPQQ